MEQRSKTMKKVLLKGVFICCLLVGFGMEAWADTGGKNSIESSKTALIIIDIQNDYFPGGKMELVGSDQAVLQAKRALKEFRARSLPIIHIQHEWKGDNPKFFAPNTQGQKIHDIVRPLSGEKVFVKHQISCFEKTPLLQYLTDRNIKRLVIAGMQTNVCVAGAVDDGIKNRFDIIVLKDALAAVDTSTHNATLPKIESKGARLMTTADLVSAISK